MNPMELEMHARFHLSTEEADSAEAGNVQESNSNNNSNGNGNDAVDTSRVKVEADESDQMTIENSDTISALFANAQDVSLLVDYLILFQEVYKLNIESVEKRPKWETEHNSPD